MVLTAVRDEQTLQDYFDYYIKLHRLRKGEATAMDMIVPPAITGTRPSTESGRHFLLYPGALVHKFHTSRRNLGLPPVAPSMEKGGSSGDVGDECAIMNDNEKCSSVVDEVILVRKLGSIFSLRDRRTKVLRQLEMVRLLLNAWLMIGTCGIGSTCPRRGEKAQGQVLSYATFARGTEEIDQWFGGWKIGSRY
jgi:hypothetical protein